MKTSEYVGPFATLLRDRLSSSNEASETASVVSLAQFIGGDFEAPLRHLSAVGYIELGSAYMAAATAASQGSQPQAQRVFRMLGDICGFHFKPEDNAEPYGPMAQFAGRRSAIPSDFFGEQAEVFALLVPRTAHPALKARLADVAWLADRKKRGTALEAVDALCECVERVLNDQASFDGGHEAGHTWLGVGYLQRALNIAHKTDFKSPAADRARMLLQRMRAEAFASKDRSIFARAARLDHQYGISNATLLAEEAIELAKVFDAGGDIHSAGEHWTLAGQIYATERNAEKQAACFCAVAECYAREAGPPGQNLFMVTHLLTKAIEQYRQVPRKFRPPGRIEELQKNLVEAQRGMPDELQTIGETTNIRDIVEQVEGMFAGKNLLAKLAVLSSIAQPKPFDFYKDRYLKTQEEFPLRGLFGNSVLDGEGKVRARTEAGEGTDDETIKAECAQSLSLDWQVEVQAALEPARLMISGEHNLQLDLFVGLAAMSPFVPEGHEHIYGLGLYRYFSGSMIEAGSILIPQLENSLRYLLRQTGEDVSKINADLTQEDINLSVLLGRLRPQLESVLGEARVFLIEMVFQNRHGPNLRNALAHGFLRTGHFQSVPMIYALWLIFKLLCDPLLPHWKKVEENFGHFE